MFGTACRPPQKLCILAWFKQKIDQGNYSQLSQRRPLLGHDKAVAYGKDQQNKPDIGLID